MADYNYVPSGPKAEHISTLSTTVVRASGGGVLQSVVINNPGASNVITVYDGVDNTGTVLAVLGGLTVAATLTYNIPVSVGITVISASGTPSDLTVIYL